jgi:hypothetical protein
VNASKLMLESKGGTKNFSRGIGDLAITPNLRCDTHKGLYRLPCHIDNKHSLGVYVCHLQHGGAQIMNKVTKTSFGLPQSPRQAPKDPDHQDRLGATNHQE